MTTFPGDVRRLAAGQGSHFAAGQRSHISRFAADQDFAACRRRQVAAGLQAARDYLPQSRGVGGGLARLT